MTRRRLVVGFAAGGALLAAGGGGAAWWLAQDGKRDDPFDIPQAVRTPKAHLLSADAGDFVVGEEPPKRLWGKFDILSDDTPAPLPVRDVVVYGALGGGLRARNVVDGEERWTASEVKATGRYLSLSDRLVAAVDDEGVLRTYVPATGKPKWKAPAAEADELLAADGAAVYVLTKDGRLRSIGRSDAKVRWTARFPSAFRGKILPPGVAGRGRLVLRSSEGDVLVVRTDDGTEAWRLAEQSDDIQIRPAAYGDTVYLNGKNLTARTLADGDAQWTLDKRDIYDRPQSWGPPAVDAHAVYVTGEWPLRLRRSDRKEICHAAGAGAYGDAPLAPQGGGIWGLGDGGVTTDVFALFADTGDQAFTYEMPVAERRWVTADGNRVFSLLDRSLLALPVF
ncbi:hypothetical protein N566_02400 [Streptomycetaceae bacterium MP113-05]|nr:hypothetical protein N566_02400 [Streptomycetaceae bacterium MP113-05]